MMKTKSSKMMNSNPDHLDCYHPVGLEAGPRPVIAFLIGLYGADPDHSAGDQEEVEDHFPVERTREHQRRIENLPKMPLWCFFPLLRRHRQQTDPVQKAYWTIH